MASSAMRVLAFLALVLVVFALSPRAFAEVDLHDYPCLTEALANDAEAQRTCLESLRAGKPVPSKLAHVLDMLLMPAHALYVKLADPQSCIVCLLLLTVLDIVRPIGAIAFDLLLIPTLVLLSLGFMFALLVGAGKVLLSPVQSARPWTDLAASSVRFVIAIVLLGGAAVLTTASLSGTSSTSSTCNSFDVFFARLIEPFMGTSISLGMVMLDHVTQHAFGATTAPRSPFLIEATDMATKYRALRPKPSTTRCRPAAPPPTAGLAGFDNLLVYASGLQLLGSLGMAQGIGFLRDAQVVSEGGARWIAFIAGVLLLLLFAVFIVVAGIRLLDPLLRVLLIVALSPLLVAAWVFGPTRSAARVGLRAFAYAFFFFVVAGVIYGIAFSLLLASAAASGRVHEDIIRCKCSTGSNVYAKLPAFPKYDSNRPHYCYCAPEAFHSFHGLRRCVLFSGGSLVVGHPDDVCNDDDPARPYIDLTQILITIISLLLAQSLIALVTSIAGSLSDYSAGDNIAQGAESQMRGLATSAVHTSAYAGATVLRTMGKKAASFLGPRST